MTYQAHASERIALLTEQQTADLLQITKGTLRNARISGALGLPFVKLTPTKRGKVRYRQTDVIAWIEAHTNKNVREAISNRPGGA